MIVIGYSGHGFVACSIAKAMGKIFTGYCDMDEKDFNPFELKYYGSENSAEALEVIKTRSFFIALGYNEIRGNVYHSLAEKKLYPVNLIHPSAVVCPTATIAAHGVMIAANAVINPLAKIGVGVICNTSSVIEHECVVEEFAHIAPGAILCGNVTIGRKTFVGAGSVIRQGITIGRNVTIGVGAVVVKNVPDGATVVGNPAR